MKKPLFLWFLLLPLIAMAQLKFDANWTFGENIGINFSNANNPVAFKPQTNNLETNASISDSLGNLLLYLNCQDNQSGIIKDALNNTIIGGGRYKHSCDCNQWGNIFAFSPKFRFHVPLPYR